MGSKSGWHAAAHAVGRTRTDRRSLSIWQAGRTDDMHCYYKISLALFSTSPLLLTVIHIPISVLHSARSSCIAVAPQASGVQFCAWVRTFWRSNVGPAAEPT